MNRTITTGLVAVVLLGLSTAAQEQDWYHDRDGRYSGDQWRSRVFLEIRTDFDHIWSPGGRQGT